MQHSKGSIQCMSEREEYAGLRGRGGLVELHRAGIDSTD